MLADTPFGLALSAWIDLHPWLTLTIWLGTGFIAGILAIKDGKCESPAGTLMFMTFGGFPLLLCAALMGTVLAPFFGVVWLFGIKAAEGGDTHGV